MTDRDIVDAIDELVDWQLAKEPSGWDHNINQARCPHWWCDADFHPLPIKQRMREIRQLWRSAITYHEDEDRVPEQVVAELDEYRYDTDESPVICPGSLFDGEFTPPAQPPYTPGPREALHAAMLMYGDLMAAATGLSADFWQLPDDPHSPNSWLAVAEPRWWRCDDVSVFEHVRLTDETDDNDWLGQPADRITIARRHYLVVDGEQIELRRSSDGHHARWGATPGEPAWLEVYAVCPPHVQHWRVLDQPTDRERTVVRVWREEDGWQELGTLTEPVQFQPAPEIDDSALAFTPGARSFTATFDIADVHPDLVHLLQGDDNPADEPAEGDQAA